MCSARIDVPTWKDAIDIARALPQVEVATWYGTPGLKVAGKGFARLRTEAEGGLVLMCSLDEKERLLESGDRSYYTTPHYDGYGAIIVNLATIDRSALRELIVQAWRMKAPPRLRATLPLTVGSLDARHASRRPTARRPARKRQRS
jgi:hypothetical protein